VAALRSWIARCNGPPRTGERESTSWNRKPIPQQAQPSTGSASGFHRRSARTPPIGSTLSSAITLMPTTRLPYVCPLRAIAGTSYTSHSAATTSGIRATK
jgi:hypothetical protein